MFRSRRAAVLLACSVVAATLAAACSGSGKTPDQTPPPPAVSPVPADVAIDLPLADSLYAEGEPDQALRIYSAAALRGGPDQKARAVWTMARIQYETGDKRGAAQNLRAFIAMKPPPEQERRAYLLLGFAELEQGNLDGAKDALQTYLGAQGAAAPYARLALAEIAGRQDDSGEAIKQADTALAAALPEPAATEALFALARYQEQDGNPAAAAATYEKLAAEAATASDRAEALWQLAQLSRRTENAQKYQQSLHSLVVQYPWHSRALQALDEPQLATAPAVTTKERALVLFRNRVNDRAQQGFQALLAEPDRQAQGEAHYYLGILAERAGDPGGALNEYGAAIGALAGSGAALLASAHWDRGLLFESIGRLEEAADEYTALTDTAPGSDQAPDALFRAGFVRFRQGRASDAAVLWRGYLAVVSDGNARSRAQFWLARADQALGDSAATEQDLDIAAFVAPLDYYGLRALALAAGEAAPQDPGPVPSPSPDWTRAELSLATSTGPEDTAARDAFFGGEGWQRAAELLEAGLKEQAATEFGALVEQTHQPWLQYRLARALSEKGQVRPAARAALALVAAQATPPPALLTLAYPARFLEAVNEAANASGVSPLLLLALVRQESFFDPAAVSPAGALGLTQVMPSTGREIAAQLDETGFKESDLLKPKVSLRFGAHYLKSQFDLFGGNIAATLAAYNGGPGNASRWQTAAGDDPDVFLEAIDFPETHTYVKTVLENYALYRYAYGVTDHPSLPLE